MWPNAILIVLFFAISFSEAIAAPKAVRKQAKTTVTPSAPAQTLTHTLSNNPEVDQTVGGLTEDEAVSVALRQNPALRAFRKERGVSEGRIMTASAWANPSLQVQLVHVQTGADMGFAVALKWAPPQPVVYSANKAVFRAALQQVEHEIADREWQLQYQVRGLHSLLLMLKREQRMSDLLLAARKLVSDSYMVRLEKGAATRIEWNQVQLAMLSLKRERDSILLKEADAQRQFRTLLGVLSAESVRVSGVIPTEKERFVIPAAEILAEQALAARPSLKAMQARIVGRQQALRVEKARRWPWFEFSARYRHTASTNYPNEVLLGIEAPLPILNWNQGPIKEASAEIDLAVGLAEAEFLALKQTVFNAHAALMVRKGILLRYEKEVLPVLLEHEELLDLATKGGQIDLIGLLSGEEVVLRERREYFEARFAFRAAWLALEAAVGRPLQEIHP